MSYCRSSTSCCEGTIRGETNAKGLLLKIPCGYVSLLHGVEGSCLVRGELVRMGLNAADGAIVCNGDVICSGQDKGSSMTDACTISSIPKSIDLDSEGFTLMLCEYGLYPW